MTSFGGISTGDIGFMPGAVPGLRGPVIHFVRPGDTLHRIAWGYRTSIRAIVLANHLHDPNRIYPGQRLLIPGTY